jgi:hypothetical protein
LTARYDRRTFLQAIAAGGSLLPAAMVCARGKQTLAAPNDSSAGATTVVDDRAQLFVDLERVESLDGVHQEFHAA